MSLLTLLLAIQSAPPPITIAELFARIAQANQANEAAGGKLAADAPEYARVFAPIIAAAEQLRVELEADRAAGRVPSSCPPPKGEAQIGSDEVFTDFGTIPLAQRGTTTVDAAFRAMMARRYPCPAK